MTKLENTLFYQIEGASKNEQKKVIVKEIENTKNNLKLEECAHYKEHPATIFKEL
nr:hypothetical protein [Bacteroidota bacterium]